MSNKNTSISKRANRNNNTNTTNNNYDPLYQELLSSIQTQNSMVDAIKDLKSIVFSQNLNIKSLNSGVENVHMVLQHLTAMFIKKDDLKSEMLNIERSHERQINKIIIKLNQLERLDSHKDEKDI